MKVAFVYPNSRRQLVDAVAAGTAPDSTLLGQNHLAEHGVDAVVHEPLLTRTRQSWLRWQLREVALPLELRGVDVVVTPLQRALPLASRVLRGPDVVVLNYGINVLLRHTTARRRRILRAALRATRLVVCLAEAQRRDLLELSGLPAEHVVTAHLGIDADFFTPGAAPRGEPPLVLAVGKDLARDYGTLVGAVRSLPVRAHLAAMPRNLRGLELPANAAAALHDPVELRSLYAQASCVVLPQHGDDHHEGTEAGGLTALLEAMASGRPIVATDRAVVREYVSDGRHALLVPPGDVDAMRAAVERVLADEELARRLGSAARARVEERFTTRQLAERLARILRGLQR